MSKKQKVIAVIDLGDCQREDLAGSCSRFAQRPLAGQSLVTRMISRLAECTSVDLAVVSGAHLPTRLLTTGIAGAQVLDLPFAHVCERLAAAADRWQAEWVVYLPGNRPFIDPVLIDRLVSQAQRTPNCDYVGFYSNGGGWRRMQHLGLAGEVCHADSLRRLRRNADHLQTDDGGSSLANCLQSVDGLYQMKFVPVPPELDRDDLRFSIEDENDWDQAELLSENFRADMTEWQPLADLVLGHSEIRQSMQVRNGG